MKNRVTHNRLSLEDVTHQFGQVAVLSKLSLNVQVGEFVAIVGPSGCGKTTLLNILSGYIKPESGDVDVKGIIRTVYQQDGLFPWLNVEENIEMGLRIVKESTLRKKEVDELIELITLKGFEKHYPHQLSGGMRQRVELARVLAGESDILLMDEPFSALDYQTRIRMRNELVRVLERRPRTVVFVTHDIEEAVQLADRVLVLSDRPSRIIRELVINCSRPRNTTDGKVVEALKIIQAELGLQV